MVYFVIVISVWINRTSRCIWPYFALFTRKSFPFVQATFKRAAYTERKQCHPMSFRVDNTWFGCSEVGCNSFTKNRKEIMIYTSQFFWFYVFFVFRPLTMCILHFVITYFWRYFLLAGDKLVGEVSRLVVAEACVQALDIDFTQGQIYEINSVQVIIFLPYYKRWSKASLHL